MVTPQINIARIVTPMIYAYSTPEMLRGSADRMNESKLRSLKKALLYSYQAATAILADEREFKVSSSWEFVTVILYFEKSELHSALSKFPAAELNSRV